MIGVASGLVLFDTSAGINVVLKMLFSWQYTGSNSGFAGERDWVSLPTASPPVLERWQPTATRVLNSKKVC